MKRISQFVALAALAFAPNVNAHEDAVLAVMPNGTISGVPSQFGTLRLNIDGFGTRDLRIAFAVGDRVTTIPPCATALIKSRSMGDVQVSGSWYHDESMLPYYLNVRFLDPWQSPDPAERSSYAFIFNLRTTELVGADRWIWKGNSVSTVPMAFPRGCKVSTAEMRPNTSLERTRER
jgi:hypothetical protein